MTSRRDWECELKCHPAALQQEQLRSFRLEGLADKEALKLIQNVISGNDSTEALLPLVRAAGGIPLLLSIMASTVREGRSRSKTSFSIEEYIKNYSEHAVDKTESLYSNESYQKSLVICLKEVLVQLKLDFNKPSGDLAVEILKRAAYVHPDSFSIGCVSEYKTILQLLQSSAMKKIFWNKGVLISMAMDLLSQYGLVDSTFTNAGMR